MLQRRQTKELLALAEEAEAQLWGDGREEWLERLDREHENLIWALRWAIGRDENETAVRLSIALYPYWLLRRELEEGQRWLRAALAKSELLPTTMRAKALSAAANLTGEGGDNARAVALHEQALELWRELGNRLQETIALDKLAALAKTRGDLEAARTLYEENLALTREIGSRRLTATALNNLATVLGRNGDYEGARGLYEDGLDLFRQAEDEHGEATTRVNIGLLVARHTGNYDEAVPLVTEGLVSFAQLDARDEIVTALEELADTANDQGKLAEAALLNGTADTLRDVLGIPRSPEPSATAEAPPRPSVELLKSRFPASWEHGRQTALKMAQAFRWSR